MRALRSVWEYLKHAIDVITAQLADWLNRPVEIDEDGEVVAKIPMSEVIARRVVAVMTGMLGALILYAPWVNPRFSGALADSLFRMAAQMWSGYEGVPST